VTTKSRLVYSTGPAGPARPQTPNTPERPAARPSSALLVRRERAGRKGKTVTLVGPLHATREEALELLRVLKRGCGSGGTVRPSDAGFALEIQGDHVERVSAELRERGYSLKGRR